MSYFWFGIKIKKQIPNEDLESNISFEMKKLYDVETDKIGNGKHLFW